MEIVSSLFAPPSQINANQGVDRERPSGQLKLVQDAAEQEAAGAVKLAEQSTATNKSPDPSLGNQLDLWA
jgi:hypothetical protein